MGEIQNRPFQLSFNASLKVGFQGSRVTSDGGLILARELDQRLGFGDLISQHLTDSRRGKNTQLPLADLLRQSVYSRIAGYEEVNDAERLSQDPTFRLIGPEKIWERGAALTSRLQSFETDLLAQEENLAGLAAINRDLTAPRQADCGMLMWAGRPKRNKKEILDVIKAQGTPAQVRGRSSAFPSSPDLEITGSAPAQARPLSTAAS
jgi:hypothetical protein